MGKILTLFKILFGIFAVLLLLSVGYLLMSSPQIQGFTNTVLKYVNSTSPQLADFLSKLGAIIYSICKLGYSVTKPVIDTLYNLLSRATGS